MSLNHVALGKAFAIAVVAAVCTFGQPMTFSSGSTGADGALNITSPGITYFNPSALGLHPVNTNIFNFTTITIAAGATLKLTEEVFHGPAFFLATGDVVISGTLDLSGGNGVSAGNQSQRQISYAGSGGYGGGLGGGPGGIPAPEPGNGPGGGAAGTATSVTGANGQFIDNQYLTPLIGGSGGGGPYVTSGAGCFGASGGAGGGAILIASSTSIAVNNSTGFGITAAGGNAVGGCNTSGAGSGGAIRLVANTITYIISNSNFGCFGASNLSVAGGSGSGPASAGILRIESFSGTSGVGCVNNLVVSTPFSLALPATSPGSLMVTSINGVPINANPFSFPDATINSSTPVTVNVQAQFIPVGTIPKIYVFGESGPDQTITCSALTGTLQQSTCSTSITFVPGGSRGFVKATW